MNIPSYVPKFYTSKFFLYLWEIKILAWVYLLGKPNRYKDLTVRAVKNFGSKRVLQMGCVPGSLSREIAEVVLGNGKLWIVDVSQNALELTKKKVKDLKNVEFTEISADNTAFLSRTFDTVIMYFLLHEVPKEVKIKLLEEAGRLLKTNSHLIIVDYHKIKDGWLKSIIEKVIRRIEPFSGELMDIDLPGLLKDKGFKIEKTILENSGLQQFVIAAKL